MNKKPKKYYFKERKGFDTPQYAGAFPYVDYASYVDLKQNKNNLIDSQEQTIKELREERDSYINHLERDNITIKQFLDCTESKATLQVLKNCYDYTKSWLDQMDQEVEYI